MLSQHLTIHSVINSELEAPALVFVGLCRSYRGPKLEPQLIICPFTVSYVMKNLLCVIVCRAHSRFSVQFLLIQPDQYWACF